MSKTEQQSDGCLAIIIYGLWSTVKIGLLFFFWL